MLRVVGLSLFHLVLGGCFDISFCAKRAHLQHGGLDIHGYMVLSTDTSANKFRQVVVRKAS